MKKNISLFLVMFMLCSIQISAQASEIDFGKLFSSILNDSSNMIPKNISLPKEFSITYEYVDDGKIREVTMERDAHDNYHYKDDEDEYLFIKDGRGYKIAIGTLNGFVYKNNSKYDFNHIKQLTEKFWKCATPLDDDITMGTTTSEGNGEVCGRKTNKYKVELGMGYSFGGYSVSMSDATYYDFDAETDICLASSSSESVSVLGMSSDDNNDKGFECIRFELHNITTPVVK